MERSNEINWRINRDLRSFLYTYKYCLLINTNALFKPRICYHLLCFLFSKRMGFLLSSRYEYFYLFSYSCIYSIYFFTNLFLFRIASLNVRKNHEVYYYYLISSQIKKLINLYNS